MKWTVHFIKTDQYTEKKCRKGSSDTKIILFAIKFMHNVQCKKFEHEKMNVCVQVSIIYRPRCQTVATPEKTEVKPHLIVANQKTQCVPSLLIQHAYSAEWMPISPINLVCKNSKRYWTPLVFRIKGSVWVCGKTVGLLESYHRFSIGLL